MGGSRHSSTHCLWTEAEAALGLHRNARFDPAGTAGVLRCSDIDLGHFSHVSHTGGSQLCVTYPAYTRYALCDMLYLATTLTTTLNNHP